jgi:hypothetical protein
MTTSLTRRSDAADCGGLPAEPTSFTSTYTPDGMIEPALRSINHAFPYA